MADQQAETLGLLLQLKDDTVELVESEVALVKAEIFDRLNTLKVSMLPLGIALSAGITASMTFAGALVLVIGEALERRYALAATLVAVGFAFVAAVAVTLAWRLIQKVTQPPAAIAARAPIHAIEVRNESVKRNHQT